MRIFLPIWEDLNTNFPSDGGVYDVAGFKIAQPYLPLGGVPPEKILAGMADPGYPRDPPGPGTFSLKRG